MARLIIDTGTEGNTATGDTLRTAMTKVNTNFKELFDASTESNNIIIDQNTLKTVDTNGNLQIQSNGTGVIELNQLQVSANGSITSLVTNGSINITPNGTGDVVLGNVTIADNKIATNVSNANLQIDASGTGAIELLTQKVIMANLPTSDPSNAGQLYNDSGTLKVSSG